MKQINSGSIHIEWYKFSAAYADSPDFITFTKNKNIDTICSSDNIADIKLKDSSNLIIGFYGRPRLYMEDIAIPNQR